MAVLDDKEKIQFEDTFVTVQYFAISTIIFYFLAAKNVNFFIIFAWVVFHVFTHSHIFSKFNEYLQSWLTIDSNKRGDGKVDYHIVAIQLFFPAVLLLRTIAVMIYSFAYTKLQMIFADKGEKYNIPKQYRFYETEYKKLHIVGTYIIFGMIALIRLFPYELFSKLQFNILEDVSGALTNIAMIFVMMLLSLFAVQSFDSQTKLDTLIYTSYMFLVLSGTLLIGKKILNYITHSLLQCKIIDDSKSESYINKGQTEFKKAMSGFFTALPQFVGILSTTLLTVMSGYEFFAAYRYNKLHSKY